jgi:hypothetical protein
MQTYRKNFLKKELNYGKNAIKKHFQKVAENLKGPGRWKYLKEKIPILKVLFFPFDVIKEIAENHKDWIMDKAEIVQGAFLEHRCRRRNGYSWDAIKRFDSYAYTGPDGNVYYVISVHLYPIGIVTEIEKKNKVIKVVKNGQIHYEAVPLEREKTIKYPMTVMHIPPKQTIEEQNAANKEAEKTLRQDPEIVNFIDEDEVKKRWKFLGITILILILLALLVTLLYLVFSGTLLRWMARSKIACSIGILVIGFVIVYVMALLSPWWFL